MVIVVLVLAAALLGALCWQAGFRAGRSGREAPAIRRRYGIEEPNGSVPSEHVSKRE
jgi:hypothetical protein